MHVSDKFALAEKEMKGSFDYRLKSLWSYDVLDHPKFIEAKKIRKRVMQFYKKRITKSIDKNHLAQISTLKTF